MKKRFIVLLAFCVTVTLLAGTSPYTPTRIPDRIILTIKTDPATSMAVTWRTDTSVTSSKASVVVSDASPSLEDKAREFKAEYVDVESDGVIARFHSVNFTNLKPETLYAYRVGDGTHWSEWFQFTTAATSAKPFSFIFFGDAQKDNKSLWSRVVRQAYKHAPDASFQLHTGDLVNGADGGGNLDLEWAEWHHAGSFINGMIPTLATPGNHEYLNPVDPKNRKINLFWKPQFTFPENGPEGYEELTYYVDYQGVRFIFLDSYALGRSDEAARIHIDWLEKSLSDNPHKWTIVGFHHPVYSTANNRDNKRQREFVNPVLQKYNVDLVLQGHDHTYARGLSPESNDKTSGPVYVVSVSGAKMYEQNSEPWWDKGGQFTQLYQIITIDGNNLDYKSFTATGQLFDHFVLQKNKKGRSQARDLINKK